MPAPGFRQRRLLATSALLTLALALLLNLAQQTLMLAEGIGIESFLGWTDADAVRATLNVWRELAFFRAELPGGPMEVPLRELAVAYLAVDAALFVPAYALLLLGLNRTLRAARREDGAWGAEWMYGLAVAALAALVVVDQTENALGLARLQSAWVALPAGGLGLTLLLLGLRRAGVRTGRRSSSSGSPAGWRAWWPRPGWLALLAAGAWLGGQAILEADAMASGATLADALLHEAHAAKPALLATSVGALLLAGLAWFFGFDLAPDAQAALAAERSRLRVGVADIVWRSRYVLAALALFGGLLLGLDQCRDVVVAAADGMAWGSAAALGALSSAVVAIAFFVFSCWLWTRLVCQVPRPGRHDHRPDGAEALTRDFLWLNQFARWWARLLGLVPLVLVGLLIAKACHDATMGSRSLALPGQAPPVLAPLWVVLFGLACVFAGGGFLWLRKRATRLGLDHASGVANQEADTQPAGRLRLEAPLRLSYYQVGARLPARDRAQATGAASESLWNLVMRQDTAERQGAPEGERYRFLGLLPYTPLLLPLLALLFMLALRVWVVALGHEPAVAPPTLAVVVLAMTWWLGVFGWLSIVEESQARPWVLFIVAGVGALSALELTDNHVVPLFNASAEPTSLWVWPAATAGLAGLAAGLQLWLAGPPVLQRWLARVQQRVKDGPGLPAQLGRLLLRHHRLAAVLLGVTLACALGNWADLHMTGGLARQDPSTRNGQDAGPLAARADAARPGHCPTDGSVPGLGWDEQAWAWLCQLRSTQAWMRSGDAPVPVFVVASEGGGMRSAHWTTRVLAEWAAQPELEFDRRTFALIGVSGGAVGEAAYLACRYQARLRDPQASGTQGAGGQTDAAPAPPLEACLARLTGSDALTPLLGAWMFEDGLARVLPTSIRQVPVLACEHPGCGFLSRNLWMERALVQALPGLGLPLRGARAQTAAGGWLPHLLLNGTWVATGERTIAASLEVDTRTFPTARDQLRDLGGELSLVTAALNAARFPYINPLGSVESGSGRLSGGHVADGGYFDNTGAHTAVDVLHGLARVIDLHCPPANDDARFCRALRQRLAPKVLLVRNGNNLAACSGLARKVPACLEAAFPGHGPRDCSPGPDAEAARQLAATHTAGKLKLFPDALGPALTAAKAVGTGANGRRAAALLQPALERFAANRGTDPAVWTIDQVGDGSLYPMGWYLSRLARAGMDQQARCLPKLGG